tara:strand:- start:140 stop:568 length:429 start_codon:yes stop_codon:yes gene_type:complete
MQMKKINSYLLFSIILVFLNACAGTGSKYLSQNEIQSNNSSNKVFIYREKGLGGSGNVPTVFYNNKKIGKIGIGEYLSTSIITDTNNIEVKTTGLMGVGMKGDIKTFKNNSNKYFLVSFDQGLLTAGWKIIEISQSQFESYF